jgi:hypothetical protein
MKKVYFVIYFAIIFFSNSAYLVGQSNSPVIGYDKVIWGSTVQTVTQTYSGLSEKKSENASVGVREFEQSDIGGGISSRTFYFYQNKLYRVYVSYGEIEASTGIALLEKIISIYGKFDDTNEVAMAESGSAGKLYSFIRYYNRNLTIQVNLVDMYNMYNYHVGTGAGIIYIDPTIWTQIESAIRREKSNELNL